MGEKPTFLCAWEKHVFLAVHSEEDPSDAEWDRGVAVWSSGPVATASMLVFSSGGGPSTPQRARLNAASAKRKDARIAIMTSSRAVQLIGTAVGWFMPNTRILSPRDRDAAVQFVSGDPATAAAVAARLDALCKELDAIRNKA